MTSKSWEPFTASVEEEERFPFATPVTALLPATIPLLVRLGPLVIVKPVSFNLLAPVTTLPTRTSSAKLNVIFRPVSIVTLIFPLLFPPSPWKFILVFALTFVSLPPLTESCHGFTANALTAFSCATFTASVSELPAATPISCRVIPSVVTFVALPILKAALVLFHTGLVLVDAKSSRGS